MRGSCSSRAVVDEYQSSSKAASECARQPEKPELTTSKRSKTSNTKTCSIRLIKYHKCFVFGLGPQDATFAVTLQHVACAHLPRAPFSFSRRTGWQGSADWSSQHFNSLAPGDGESGSGGMRRLCPLTVKEPVDIEPLAI